MKLDFLGSVPLAGFEFRKGYVVLAADSMEIVFEVCMGAVSVHRLDGISVCYVDSLEV